MQNKSLQEIVSITSRIEEQLLLSGGEITPDIEAALVIKEQELPSKVDDYALLIDRMDSISNFYKKQAEGLIALSKAAERISDMCSERIRKAMDLLQTSEVVGFNTKWKLVNSNPECVIEDENKIDPAYTVMTRKVDKKRITEDLKLGVPVDGARLEPKKSLRRYIASPNDKAGVK